MAQDAFTHPTPQRSGFRWWLLLPAVGLLVGLWWFFGHTQPTTPAATVAESRPPPLWATKKLEDPITPVTPPAPPRNEVAEMLAQYMRESQKREAMQDEQLRALNASLDELSKRPPPSAPPAGSAEKPKLRPHRPMGFQEYKLASLDAPQELLYTLAPWTTSIPCQAYTKAKSTVGEFATGKITSTVYDTATGRIPLIPQNSTIGIRYDTTNLLHGDSAMLTAALELTLPSGKVVDLGSAPVTDQEGVTGLVSHVDQRFWFLARAVLIQGVLGQGVPRMIQSATAGGGAAGHVASGIAQTSGQAVSSRTQPALNTKPIVTINPGEVCNVLLTKALELPAAY